MRWGPRPAAAATIAARVVWLVVCLLMILVPLVLLKVGVIERLRGGIALLWLAAFGGLAWLLLYAQPGPFGAWDAGALPGWRRWLRKLVFPLVLVSWIAMQALVQGRLHKDLAQLLFLALVMAVVLVFRRDPTVAHKPEELEANERSAARWALIGKVALVAWLLYSIAGMVFLWWLLTNWR